MSKKYSVCDPPVQEVQYLDHPLYSHFNKMRAAAAEESAKAIHALDANPQSIESLIKCAGTESMIACLDEVLRIVRDWIQRN